MQSPEHQFDARGMLIPLFGTDTIVPGAVEPLLDMGCGEHSVKRATRPSADDHLFVVSLMLALRWIEENVTKYRESKTPTVESIHAIGYSRRLDLFETAC